MTRNLYEIAADLEYAYRARNNERPSIAWKWDEQIALLEEEMRNA